MFFKKMPVLLINYFVVVVVALKPWKNPERPVTVRKTEVEFSKRRC